MRLQILMIVAVLALLAPAARATIIYDWKGTCTVGCVGTASVTLHLDDSYVPGSAVTPFDGTGTTVILGFEWHMPSDGIQLASDGSLFAPSQKVYGSAANPLVLPVDSGPGSGTLFTFGGYTATYLSTFLDGSWRFGSGMSQTSVCSQTFLSGGCQGTSGQWVVREVAEPATPSLLGLGLVALAGMAIGRRKRQPGCNTR